MSNGNGHMVAINPYGKNYTAVCTCGWRRGSYGKRNAQQKALQHLKDNRLNTPTEKTRG